MAFADVEDVATRLGRDLSDTDAAKAELLLELAIGAIVNAVDKDDAWAAALSPVPVVIKLLTIELVVRSMPGTPGLRSKSQTLGQYQSSESYADPGNGGGILLTDVEERLVRRTVFGRTSGSAKTASIVEDIYPCLGS